MPKITKEEAIAIGNKMMEKVSIYRLNTIRYADEGEIPHWVIVYLRLDEEGNPKKMDPNTTYVLIDAESGEGYFRMTL